MALSIILATRGRPQLLIPTIERTLASMALASTKLVIAVDHDDQATIDALSQQGVLAGHADPRLIASVMPREDTLGEKYNNRLPVAPADVYLVMVDYAPMVTPGFDQLILDAAASFPDKIGVVYGNRMANLSFPEINAVTHRLVELMGGIYPPYFPYWYVDHWLDDISRMIGRIAVAEVWHDGSKRPGTQELREPAFWASLYDDLAPLRRQQAQAILDAPDFADEPWRKAALKGGWVLVEKRAKIINDHVRATVRGADLPHDARYQRAKTRAAEMLRSLGNRQSAVGNSVATAGAASLAAQLDTPWGQQNPEEMAWLLELIRDARSVLEIGSCFGRSLEHMAQVLRPGAVIRSIDLGRSEEWLPGVDTTISLRRVIADLKARGFDADLMIGDSKTPEAHAWAKASGPPVQAGGRLYDVVFIDGDHGYNGVLADWLMYGPMARVVAFHDIAHPEHGVSKVWAEIKAQGFHVEQKIASGMGIGVVIMPEKAAMVQAAE